MCVFENVKLVDKSREMWGKSVVKVSRWVQYKHEGDGSHTEVGLSIAQIVIEIQNNFFPRSVVYTNN